MASGEAFPPSSEPVGYRFHPTDEEIVSHFLKNKMLGNDHLVQAIPEVEVCKFDPWELPNVSVVKSDDPEWYFFSTRDLKYCHGHRTNRSTRSGFWKATGRDRIIRARRTKREIGTKKTLVFHRGRVPKGARTNWVIHEYHSADNRSLSKNYVVCRLMKKDDEKVDQSADGECGNDSVDSDIQNNELHLTSAHLKLEKGIDFDEFMRLHIDPLDNLLTQSPWTGSTHLDGAMFGGEDTDFEATGSLFEGLPPNWSMFSEYSSQSVQPQMQMMISGGSMLQSNHLRLEELSGQVMSGRKIRLQRSIRNAALNPIEAAESSSECASNDHPKESQTGKRPPSEYFANVVVGIVLFVVFAREMVLYAEWGMLV